MYHYTESGLRNVWLRNGFTVHKTPYGDGIAIDDLPGLHKSLSLALVMKPGKLSGTEIRFMRKEIEMSQSSLAALLGTNVQTLAAWEKGKAKISGPADKMLRFLVKGHFSGNVHVRRLLDVLNSLDSANYEGKMIFQEENRKWQMAR
ncbi:transcriptional regulator [Xylella fastidiosa subsp. fastidiosa]|nr:XRE family transcriptional regulator [Xylella fastidiosa subsp. sandyi Ann-1]RWA36709.1 transcriptional regulator [Xylella fastidiosa subsp. multiplex]RWA39319.1 transcriptional regulator [Xylella fastidiosa subsp. fastidiosa]